MNELKTNVSDGIMWITLNRPKQRNALTVPTLRLLLDAVNTANVDTEARCVVITGEGRGFCSGADLAEWAEAEASGTLETYGWTETAHQLMLTLSSLNKPTIAAINGSAVGAGLDLSLCCDFRYASQSAKFVAGYTSMAYTPDAGGSWLLPRLIGVEAAKQFLFFDQPWNCDQALNAGMITQSCSNEDLLETVTQVARQLAQGPTFAYGETKALLDSSAGNSFAEQLLAEQQAGIACGRTQDAVEAVKASIEKRSPTFTGR
jgi:2-(1,2-epoxy-1,2-dihydrophenyl)acetyl-CoA isomerase